MIDKTELKMYAAVKIVQEITPVFKDRILVFILRQLVVDIVKPDTFGIDISLHPANTIPSHFFVGNGLLNGKFLYIFFSILLFICGLFSFSYHHYFPLSFPPFGFPASGDCLICSGSVS